MRRFNPVIAIITGSLFFFILNEIMNYIFDSISINGMLGSELITILVLVLLILGGFITAFITNRNRLLCAFCVGLFIAIIYNTISIINNAIYIAYYNPISAIVFFILIALFAALITTVGGFIAVRVIRKYVNDLNDKGIDLDEVGKHEEAIKYFNMVLKIDPDDAETLYEKGVNLKKLGKHEQAIKYFDKALQLDPDDNDAQKGKEEILSMIQSKNT